MSVVIWVMGSIRKVKVTPLILLILGVSGLYCDSHFLRYYHSGVSASGSGLPVFSSVAYVDDKEITNYNSDTRQYLPKAEWMKKLGPEYWERNTQINQQNELTYEHNVLTAMKRFNQTEGFHSYQMMLSCELRDDGSTAEYSRYNYDGREFMYLDTQRWTWVPTMNEAQITTQRWNSPEMRTGEKDKNYLKQQCIQWLKKHITNGRDELEKKVHPKVKVWSHPKSDGVTRLQCLVYGFHPRPVNVKWVRNEEDHVPSNEMTPILPHPDGTYQIRVSVEVPAREGDTYSCHVDHSSLGTETFKVIWEPKKNLPINVIVGAITCFVAVAVAVAVFGTIFLKKYKKQCKNLLDHQNKKQCKNLQDHRNSYREIACVISSDKVFIPPTSQKLERTR